MELQKCPHCGQRLNVVIDATYDAYAFTEGRYYFAPQLELHGKLLCFGCERDVSDLFPDGIWQEGGQDEPD